jgi:hypothetical protein
MRPDRSHAAGAIVASMAAIRSRSSVDPSDQTVIVALACIIAAGLLYTVYVSLWGVGP